MGSLSTDSRASLEAALEDYHLKYTLANPLSKKSHEEACKYMPGGNTRTVLHATPFPLSIASGAGCMLKTIDGQEYVDFLGEYTAGIYGHSHPVIRKALEDALDHGWNYGGQHQTEQELAKIVCERFPAIQKVRFVNSGTEANMLAIATAIAYTGKKKILVFDKGYHGSTISGRISNAKANINLPHEFVVAQYNDVEGTREVLEALPADSLAAILLEPCLGSGGCYMATQEFLSSLRQLAADKQALLIFDEVMTSRLSYHGLGSQLKITPDLMTCGKWVGGGMSFGCFGGRNEIMDMYHPTRGKLEHPGTFNNNVFSMRAGVAGCTLLDKNAIDRLNGLGETLCMKIEEVFGKDEFGITGTIPSAPVSDEMQSSSHPQRPPKMFVKGVGSILTIQFAGPERALLQGMFYHHMLQSGIYMAQRGFMGLNIMLTEDHVNKFVQAVEMFCQSWANNLRW